MAISESDIVMAGEIKQKCIDEFNYLLIQEYYDYVDTKWIPVSRIADELERILQPRSFDDDESRDLRIKYEILKLTQMLRGQK